MRKITFNEIKTTEAIKYLVSEIKRRNIHQCCVLWEPKVLKNISMLSNPDEQIYYAANLTILEGSSTQVHERFNMTFTADNYDEIVMFANCINEELEDICKRDGIDLGFLIPANVGNRM